MSKKMLLLSVPLALMLTACNGNDNKPTASLPNNPSQPSNPSQPGTGGNNGGNQGTQLAATSNDDDLNVAARDGVVIAANRSANLNTTQNPNNASTRIGSPNVTVQFEGVEGTDAGSAASIDTATTARLTIDGTAYELTGAGTGEFSNDAAEGETTVTASLLNGGANVQSRLVRYEIDASTDGSDTEAATTNLTTGYATIGALTADNRVPTTGTATYTGTAELVVGSATTAQQTLTGDATVEANFGAAEANRFNGTNFAFTRPVLEGTVSTGTLTVADGSSSGTGNAFSAGLTGTDFGGSLGSNVNGTMNGNFFGDRAEEVAGSLTASGTGGNAAGGFIARSGDRATIGGAQ
jgi:hypothetical protein